MKGITATLAVMLLVSIGTNLLRVSSVAAQTSVPNGILSMGANPAGYCQAQTAPNGLNGQTQEFLCLDLGGAFIAPSGQKFAPLSGGGGGAAGNNCTALKLNSVNSDGSWNMTCGTPGWH